MAFPVATWPSTQGEQGCQAQSWTRDRQKVRHAVVGPVGNFFWIFPPGPFCCPLCMPLVSCVETHLPGHSIGASANHWWEGGQAGVCHRQRRGPNQNLKTQGERPFSFLKKMLYSATNGHCKSYALVPKLQLLLKQPILSGLQRNILRVYFPSKFRNFLRENPWLKAPSPVPLQQAVAGALGLVSHGTTGMLRGPCHGPPWCWGNWHLTTDAVNRPEPHGTTQPQLAWSGTQEGRVRRRLQGCPRHKDPRAQRPMSERMPRGTLSPVRGLKRGRGQAGWRQEEQLLTCMTHHC